MAFKGRGNQLIFYSKNPSDADKMYRSLKATKLFEGLPLCVAVAILQIFRLSFCDLSSGEAMTDIDCFQWTVSLNIVLSL